MKDPDWFHEQYLETIAQNWTLSYWRVATKEVRWFFFDLIHYNDPQNGPAFTRLWERTWSLEEEVRLTGEATAILSHPHESSIMRSSPAKEAIMEDRTWNAYENRCDRCGAESWFRFERLLTTNAVGDPLEVQDFYFCGHHGRKVYDALIQQGWTVDDFTHQINPEPSVSANAA